MIRRPPRSTQSRSSAASDVYKRQAAVVDPTPDQAKASAAATIYALWRSRFIANTIDGVLGAASLPTPPNALALTALRNLLEQFGVRGGFGESGVNFFNVSGC